MAEYPNLRGHGMISIDVETMDPAINNNGVRRGGYIAGIAVGTERGFRAYYPIAHEAGANLPKKKVLAWLQTQMSLPVPKVGANLLYDLDYLAEAGVNVVGPFYDVQIAEPLLDENQFNYSLERIAQTHLGESKKTSIIDDAVRERWPREKKPKTRIWQLPGDVVAAYAIADIDLPLRIFAKQKVELERQGLWDLFILESKLLPMLLAMRRRGVRVDVNAAERLYARMKTEQAAVEADIKRQSGVAIDPWNAKSLASVFDHFGLDYPRTPKTKAPSFTSQWLDQNTHGVSNLIRRVRGLDKLSGTFIKNYILEGNVGGRIHCQFNSLKGEDGGTVTGRFSSSNPNLQNIPTRTDDGKLIRSLFIPERGQLWWKFDWSQIEYRLMASDAFELGLPGSKEVVAAYQDDDADYHKIVAEMTGLSRSNAKTINFGIAYGEGVAKLCAALGLTEKEGKRLLAQYHARAPFIRPLMQYMIDEAEMHREVRTLLRRKRRFNMWETRNWDTGVTTYHKTRVAGSKVAFAYRALNARIQGSAADVMKSAMVQVWESGCLDVIGVPHLTVHDELDGSFEDNAAGREAIAEVKHIMETCQTFAVPLRADGGVGKNWGDIK